MGQDQVAARREPVEQQGYEFAGLVGVGEVVQDERQAEPGRLAEVDERSQPGVVEDLSWLAEIPLDHGDRGMLAGEQGQAVRQHDRVVVDVDHAGSGMEAVRDLVDVGTGRQPGADVDELRDAGARDQEVDGADDEGTVFPRGERHIGSRREDHPRCVPVGGEVVFAADVVVEHPGRIGPP